MADQPRYHTTTSRLGSALLRPTPLRTAAIVLLALAIGVTLGVAQVTQVRPVMPTVTSGPDLGFRIEGYKGAKPVGRLVVKIDGQWVEADFAAGVIRLTQ